jgi:Ribosomal proteins 50S-L15, 50S-L18e, 60S-L27A
MKFCSGRKGGGGLACGDMPLTGEWERRQERLRAERRAMKKAVHRLDQLEKWASEGQKVEETSLSLARLFSDALAEERARLDRRSVEKALGVRASKISRRATLKIKTQTEIPAGFDSLP